MRNKKRKANLGLNLTRTVFSKLISTEKVIQDFVARHAISKNAFRTWLDVLKSADWSIPEDMKETFPATDNLWKGYYIILGNKIKQIYNGSLTILY